ncbi:ATP-binding protein [Dactylosporangium cerinum]
MYRLLSVTISRFQPDTDDEAPVGGLDALPFAAALGTGVAAQLRRLSYVDQQTVVDVSAADLGTAVRAFLRFCDAGDIVIVHVLSHGAVHPRTAKLHVVGADGVVDPDTDVEQWLATAEGRDPHVLFLLDVCYGGTAARIDWQGNVADGERRAWVIAATDQRELAFNGRFSEATATVLARIATGGLDLAAGWQFVPARTLAQQIRREVDRLGEGGYPQRVVGTRVDLASEEYFPFVPNPRYQAGAAAALQQRSAVDSSARPFLDELDEALDWRHFAARAAGTGSEADPGRPGAFRGRSPQLRRLADWLDAVPAAPGLLLVTGSPGAGKSALLGITVCAAHPVLSSLCEPLWRDRRDDLPAVNAGLVVVHARRLRLEDVVASVGRQLGCNEPLATTDALVAAVAQRAAPAVIVLDALDEASDPVAVLDEVLLPLATTCRLVVGARSWPEFQALREDAEATGGVLDLDEVPSEELRDDLAGYVTDLLRPQYRTAAQRYCARSPGPSPRCSPGRGPKRRASRVGDSSWSRSSSPGTFAAGTHCPTRPRHVTPPRLFRAPCRR